MKSLRHDIYQKNKPKRKTSTGNKWTTSRKLDRKSSRGMIYENEELRLRTININAEVERGQSDIRKLRRENEQLRREIWSLRDEYDRLNKLLRQNRSTESCGGGGGENNGNNSGTQDYESDSCETCKEDDGDDDIICDDIQCTLRKNKCDLDSNDIPSKNIKKSHQTVSAATTGSSSSPTITSPLSNSGSKEITENYENSQKSSILDGSRNFHKNVTNSNCTSNNDKSVNTLENCYCSEDGAVGGSGCNFSTNDNDLSGEKCISGCVNNINDRLRDNLHVNFDHLSVVSEETLTNSDGNSINQSNGFDQSNDLDHHLEPILENNNKFSKRNSDIESRVPPLSHFENISYENAGPSLADLEDINYSTTSTTTTGETVIAANGWGLSSPTQSTTSYPTPYKNNLSNSQKLTFNNYDNNQLKTLSSSPTISQHLLNSKAMSHCVVTTDMEEQIRSPKHFFAPIKPSQLHQVDLDDNLSSPSSLSSSQQHQNYNGPDLCVSNACTSSPHRSKKIQSNSPSGKNCNSSDIEPIYADVHKPSQKPNSEGSFQTGGNLEELLMDIETLSKDILQMQLQKRKSLSEDNLDNIDDNTITFRSNNDRPSSSLSNRKPFKSEMNLVLTYNGTNPVITPIIKSSTSTSLTTCNLQDLDNIESKGVGIINDFTAQSGAVIVLDRESPIGTPPLTNIPEPMPLLPEDRPYLGFENFGQPPVATLKEAKPILSSFGKTMSSSHITQNQQQHDEKDMVATEMVGATPPLPPRATASSNRTELKKSDHTEECTLTQQMKNKKHKDIENFILEATNFDSSSGSESNAKRVSRRVSLLFKKSQDKKKRISTYSDKDTQNQDILNGMDDNKTAADVTIKITTNDEIQQKMPADTIINQDNTNNETNSPHSCRRSNGSLSSIPVQNNINQHHRHSAGHHHHHHNHLHTHQARKGSQDLGKLSLSSQSSNINNTNINTLSLIQQLDKCRLKISRRHSEGTVLTACTDFISGNDISGNVGVIGGGGSGGSSGEPGTNRPHHHHHHRHHHHPANHSTGTGGVGGNYGETHRSRHDSYNDGPGGGTSISERNSNSIPSSRESSTSLSTRSNRRKISISSHSGGGKIPWCGCWGNGCL